MRNYKKEAEWRKKKYATIYVNIDKKLGENLRKKLSENNQSLSSWITENARKYLNTRNWNFFVKILDI